jgi:hypothetical protein
MTGRKSTYRISVLHIGETGLSIKPMTIVDEPDSVSEKMFIAVSCLCNEGSFKERLKNATTALLELNNLEPAGELAADFKFIRKWTTQNMVNGVIQREPDEFERRKIVEKMLHVLTETAKRQVERQ